MKRIERQATRAYRVACKLRSPYTWQRFTYLAVRAFGFVPVTGFPKPKLWDDGGSIRERRIDCGPFPIGG